MNELGKGQPLGNFSANNIVLAVALGALNFFLMWFFQEDKSMLCTGVNFENFGKLNFLTINYLREIGETSLVVILNFPVI